ncbi:DUF6119 family protein [Streptomyces sp. NBC_01515]|uniref:DUF6119 family protein n=1 Tax=Streptomyces sp. NBC_01515 TaxID=2903890 RepID=UPI003866E30C
MCGAGLRGCRPCIAVRRRNHRRSAGPGAAAFRHKGRGLLNAAHCPGSAGPPLLHDFGTLRVAFGILLKDGQDIRVDSLFAFARVSLLQAVGRLHAMNAEVSVVAVHR